MLPLHHAGVSPTEVEPPYRCSDEPTHKDLADRRVPISPLQRIAFFSAIRCFFQKIRFQSRKCFHHCGDGTSMPFLTCAIGWFPWIRTMIP